MKPVGSSAAGEGSGAHAEGSGARAEGSRARVEGSCAQAVGSGVHALGSGAGAEASGVRAEGSGVGLGAGVGAGARGGDDLFPLNQRVVLRAKRRREGELVPDPKRQARKCASVVEDSPERTGDVVESHEAAEVTSSCQSWCIVSYFGDG